MVNTHRLHDFSGSPPRWDPWQWRATVVNFLNAVWSHDCGLPSERDLPFDPELAFGDVVLWWGSDTFVGFIEPGKVTIIESPPPFDVNHALMVDADSSSVEAGLIRFVKNKWIKVLIIRLNPGEIWLWKKKAQGELGVWATGLPKGRPDASNTQAADWLNGALADVFKRGAPSFSIEPAGKNSPLFQVHGTQSYSRIIPRDIASRVIQRLLIMAQITLDYQYAPAAGTIELGVKGVGKYRISIIATHLPVGYKIEATINLLPDSAQ